MTGSGNGSRRTSGSLLAMAAVLAASVLVGAVVVQSNGLTWAAGGSPKPTQMDVDFVRIYR